MRWYPQLCHQKRLPLVQPYNVAHTYNKIIKLIVPTISAIRYAARIGYQIVRLPIEYCLMRVLAWRAYAQAQLPPTQYCRLLLFRLLLYE
jgi:hypothetical protein